MQECQLSLILSELSFCGDVTEDVVEMLTTVESFPTLIRKKHSTNQSNWQDYNKKDYIAQSSINLRGLVINKHQII